MRSFILIISVVFFASAGAAGQSVTEKTDPAAAKEIFATIADWADAVRNRDTKALDKVFEADAIITAFDGTTRGKAEELEIFKPGGLMQTVSIRNDDIKLRIFGSAAVVTALMRMNFVVGEKESTSAFRYTAVFLKKDGRWQIVALQSGRAPQPVPAR